MRRRNKCSTGVYIVHDIALETGQTVHSASFPTTEEQAADFTHIPYRGLRTVVQRRSVSIQT